MLVLISVLAVLVILGGSLSVFAQPPRKAQVIGAIYGGDGSTGTLNLNILPVNNNIFGVYSNSTLTNCTRVYLYFSTSFDSVTSFSLQLKVLSSFVALGSQSTAYCRLNNISSTGVVSDSTTIGSNIQLNTDTSQQILSWVYSGTVTGRSAFLVTITFQGFVLDTNPLYFETLSLTVNGESTPLTYSDEQLQHINETLNDDSTYYQPSTEIPSPDASHIGDGGSFASSALNEKLGLFDLSGAVQRTLVPIGTYLFTPNSFGDSSSGHTVIVAISTISMALLVIVWIINSLHRSRGWFE